MTPWKRPGWCARRNLKNKAKIATQMGTQIHAVENHRRMVELVRRGATGTVKEAHVWCSRTPDGGSYLPEQGPPQEHLNWDLWIGPSPLHPYNPGYMGGCLAWNRFWDFGSGQIGDMGSHMMDMAFWALDLRLPATCEAAGTPVSTDTCPTWLTAKWDHPANDWRPALKVFWYDGGKRPDVPGETFDKNIFKAALFLGDKGNLLCDYGYWVLMSTGDMTHCKSPKPEELIPPSPGHHQEWIIGAKTGKPTLCNFDYSGALVEHNLLALVAYRVGPTADCRPLVLANSVERGRSRPDLRRVPRPPRTMLSPRDQDCRKKPGPLDRDGGSCNSS